MAVTRDTASRDEKRAAMARSLASDGFGDVLVIQLDTATAVLTEKRRSIVEYLREEQPDSVRALARDLDRDKGSVSRDLSLLAEHDVITYRREGTGKVPQLKHDTIVVEPIV